MIIQADVDKALDGYEDLGGSYAVTSIQTQLMLEMRDLLAEILQRLPAD